MFKSRLTLLEKEKLLGLIKEGKSLNEVCRVMERSKTTIYYYFRKIKGKTVSPISVNSSDEDKIGEFMGLFAGDGSFYKTDAYCYGVRLHFNLSERDFVNSLIEEVLIPLFGKRPMISVRENRLNLCYYSKNIYTLIDKYLTWDKNSRKTYSVQLREKNHSKKFRIGFLRGSIDSDGYISSKRICFSTVSNGLAEDTSFYLKEMNLIHSVRLYHEKRLNRKNIYHIDIWKRDFSKFLKLIRPRNKKWS